MSTIEYSATPGLGKPAEEIWQRAVIDFARAHELPQEDVLRGRMFSVYGAAFRFQYNVELDEKGLTVQMDLGPVPSETAHIAQLEMLAHNTRTPAGLLGWFGLFPVAGHGARCVRLDLDKCPEPAMALDIMVHALADSLHEHAEMLEKMFRDFAGIDLREVSAGEQGAAQR